jgi:hypothetical protein
LRRALALARSTLAEWVGRLGVALGPLAERLAELLRQRPVLHADETPVRQLECDGWCAAHRQQPGENAIRPVCLGKKNWLFVGSERAGKRVAAIQSLLATAELNGLDPAAWLRDTLEKLPTCLNRDIDSLLPLVRAS